MPKPLLVYVCLNDKPAGRYLLPNKSHFVSFLLETSNGCSLLSPFSTHILPPPHFPSPTRFSTAAATLHRQIEPSARGNMPRGGDNFPYRTSLRSPFAATVAPIRTVQLGRVCRYRHHITSTLTEPGHNDRGISQ